MARRRRLSRAERRARAAAFQERFPCQEFRARDCKVRLHYDPEFNQTNVHITSPYGHKCWSWLIGRVTREDPGVQAMLASFSHNYGEESSGKTAKRTDVNDARTKRAARRRARRERLRQAESVGEGDGED